MMKLFLTPTLSQVTPENGIGQVVLAQHRYLPDLGIQIVDEPRLADVIACHAGSGITERVDCAHLHGLYWTGDKEGIHYENWHSRVNRKVIDTCKKSRIITVPSHWVGECFRRDMRIDPIVIGHGIELDEWQHPSGKHGGYVLWNKNRGTDVCDPTSAWELASRGVPVISTFAPQGKPVVEGMTVIGVQSYQDMRDIMRRAEIYLATTQETFGIGTLEAMAAGIPILGYDWGGTSDLVKHKVTGYLVQPGDFDGLYEGYQWLHTHRKQISQSCVESSKTYSWPAIMAQYASIYQSLLTPEPEGLAVIIPNYNYARFIGEAITSVLSQNDLPQEIIVVDDGSTDNSREIIASFGDKIHAIYQENQGVAAARNTGIATAKQPFIICLDADDRLNNDYVGTVRRALTSDRALGIAYTGILILEESGREWPAEWPPEFSWQGQTTPHVPPSNCIPSAAAFRKSMWERAGGYRQSYAPGEDTEFWTRGLSVGFDARMVTNTPLFEYRAHKNSASRTHEYVAIDGWLPWMRDKDYPMAAPARLMPKVRSYARPVVSVIIPVGPGHAKYLPSALDSLLGQTLREWEVIVVDDGGEIGNELAPYPFVRLLRIEKAPLGAGSARNLGILNARAPLLYFLDADDYLMPDALKKSLILFVKTGHYIFSDYSRRDGDGQEQVMHIMDYDRQAYIDARQVHAVSALVPTEWVHDIGGFDPDLPGWEEYDFYMRMAAKGYCGEHLSEPLLVYRTHAGTRRNLSQANQDKLIALFEKRFPGGMTMPGCCGGNAEALLAAKQMMQTEVKIMTDMVTSQPGSGMVRMEFTGDWEGPVRFVANGREYHGANTPLYKYFDAPEEDATVLERTGKFRRIVFKAPEPVAPSGPLPEPQTIIERATPKPDIIKEKPARKNTTRK
jgi:glycosyltransferase involved in cell wall biosynthesis